MAVRVYWKKKEEEEDERRYEKKERKSRRGRKVQNVKMKEEKMKKHIQVFLS